MKVLAINGSPMMDKGNTALILAPFLKGMNDAGAQVELFYPGNLKINPCQGEFHCWFNTPGKCFQQDDMQTLLPKFGEADIWVLATPLFLDGITGPMKNLLDRLIPLLEPYLELRDGHSRHPLRDGVKQGKVALVSNCGLWEPDNFDSLVEHIKAVCKNVNRDFSGALLRPNGPILRVFMDMGMPPEDILEAARQAGYELVKSGSIPPACLDVIGREFIPLEMFIENANQHIRQILDEIADSGR
jgi:multimeric flavodoxin WrbA